MGLPKTLEELNVKHLRLMNGDSIMSYVHDNIEDGAFIGLEEPMLVILDDIDQSYSLAPYLPFATSQVHLLDAYQIMLEAPVNNAMKATYMKLVLDEIQPEGVDTDTVLH